MISTPNPQAIEPNDDLIARADEQRMSGVKFFPKRLCSLSGQAIEPIDCHLGARSPSHF